MRYEDELERLETLCNIPFSRTTGPRRRYIAGQLSDYDPIADQTGNIWTVQEGKTDTTIVVSSHMDTVFGRSPGSYSGEHADTPDGRTLVMGALDNAVGCWMNLNAIEDVESDHTIYHVFTVNEEYGMSGAHEFRRTLESLSVEPDLYVVLDVTPGDGYGRFDDDCAGYVDNVPTGRLRDWMNDLDLPADVTPQTKMIPDESIIYALDGPSFTVGPAVYGDMHTNECYTELRNLEETQQFLNGLLESDMDDLPAHGRLGRAEEIGRTAVGGFWDLWKTREQWLARPTLSSIKNLWNFFLPPPDNEHYLDEHYLPERTGVLEAGMSGVQPHDLLDAHDGVVDVGNEDATESRTDTVSGEPVEEDEDEM